MKLQKILLKQEKLRINNKHELPLIFHFYFSSTSKSKIFTKRSFNKKINGTEICHGFCDFPFINSEIKKVN